MKQQGFTLVEIAVVLVIIGLLLGGILNARSLISSMQAKDVIAIVDDLRTATTYFKQRYNYLPGDWPYTAGEIANTDDLSPGNGDGSIGVIGDINGQGWAVVNSEVAEAPWQLYSAGFISKIDASDYQRPPNKPSRLIKTIFGGVHIASAAIADNLVAGFAAANPAARNAIVFFNLPCDIVMQVDDKIDNGVTVDVPVSPGGRAFGTGCAPVGVPPELIGPVTWYAVAL